MSALENFYKSLGNVVLRDENGNPSIFVRHPKMLSSDFDSFLPDHVHPAFVYGTGNDEVEDDAVLIGKYASSELVPGGSHYSLPNAAPLESVQADVQISESKIPENDHNISHMTVYDFGLLVLEAHMLGIRTVYSNNAAGSDYRDGTVWKAGTHTKGEHCTFRGDLYECVTAHTSTTEAPVMPVDNPGYWRKVKHVGGTPASYWSGSGITPAYAGTAKNVLTGSGPARWYLNGDIWRETDLTANTLLRGFRIVKGQIQILPNHIASDPTVDMFTTTEWRAILPSETPHEYTLVAPEDDGEPTEGTVHIKYANGKIVFMGRAREQGEVDDRNRNVMFKDDFVNDPETLPYVPWILYELGMFPIPGTVINGRKAMHAQNDTTYLCAFQATSYNIPASEAAAGAANSSMYRIDSRTEVINCARLRAREIAEA